MQTDDRLFTLKEMARHIKKRCSIKTAQEISLMFYRLAFKHGYNDRATLEIIDGIEPAVRSRKTYRQTLQIPSITQFNNNPQNVINHGNQD